VTDEQIAALDNGDTSANCFTNEQQAAFAFSDEVMDLIEVTDRTYEAAKQPFSGGAPTESCMSSGTYMSHVPSGRGACPSMTSRRRPPIATSLQCRPDHASPTDN
jgi:hypothetical protein